ncbi:MAG: MerR family transcriptional regulator [Acidobacteriota bacterium]
MGTVCDKTGLTADVIRAWERRYRAVAPARTAGNQRAFSDADVFRLQLLQQATQVGRSIGKVAALETGDLAALVAKDHARLEGKPNPEKERVPRRMRVISERCMDAVQRMDSHGLERQLEAAFHRFGWTQLLEQLLLPLLAEVVDSASEGELSMACEHTAAAAVRSFVDSLCQQCRVEPRGPALVIAAPLGQIHEAGASLLSACAAGCGIPVLYLGADVMADDLAIEILDGDVGAVVLSLSYPAEDPTVERELTLLRRLVGEEVPILAGGRAATSYQQALEAADVVHITGLRDYQDRLRKIFRTPGQRSTS